MSSTSASASASAAASIVPEGPRHAVITADSQGAVLQIAAWFLMVVMILSVLLRLFIRFTTAHLPGTDDAVLCLAAVCLYIQTSSESSLTAKYSCVPLVRSLRYRLASTQVWELAYHTSPPSR